MPHSFFQLSGRRSPRSPSDFPVVHIGFVSSGAQAGAPASPRGRDGLKGVTAGRSGDRVSVTAALSSPSSQVVSDHCLWSGEAVITKLRFASTGQSVSSERQNLCATPGLNIERVGKAQKAEEQFGPQETKQLRS